MVYARKNNFTTKREAFPRFAQSPVTQDLIGLKEKKVYWKQIIVQVKLIKIINKKTKQEMEVIVLGTGCSSCKALYKSVEEAIKELNIEANLIKEEDLVKIMEYNVLRTPALVIDGKVVASGVKLSVNQAKELLTK